MSRLLWLLSIIALVVFAVGMERALAQARVPEPGGVYGGTLTDATGECSTGSFTMGATFSLTMADYNTTITSLHVTDVTLAPLLTSPTSLDVPVTIPVAGDGSFNNDFVPFELGEGSVVVLAAHVDGRFQGTDVSGSFRVTAGAEVCGGTFQAHLASTDHQEKTFDEAVEQRDGCGGGSISIIRGGDLLSITKISIDGLVVGGKTFSGSVTFPAGTVPIDPDTGAFESARVPGNAPGQEMALSGSFSPSVQGSIAVSPSTCGPIKFPAPVRPCCVASTKSGTSWSWELLAAVLGVGTLAAGLAGLALWRWGR